MSPFEVLAVIILITAVLGYINQRTLRLPATVAAMVGGMLVSFSAHRFVPVIDLDDVLLGGMLSFLLFAGALNVDISALRRRRWSIFTMATLSTVLSAVIVGYTMYFVLGFLGLHIRLVEALLFGALISPTDPVAVLGIMRDSGVSDELSAMVAGESLFNDGVGVVLFGTFTAILTQEHGSVLAVAAQEFAREAVGGVAYGFALGYLAYRMLRSIDSFTVEIAITLAVVTAGYAGAMRIGVSGPLAMVVAGLWVGNHGRAYAMSDTTRMHLDVFWTVVDHILNAILFVIVGFEVMLLQTSRSWLIAAAIAIAVALLARALSVGLPLVLIQPRKDRAAYTIRVMIWGGLRGGIAVALALSMPQTDARPLLLLMTYAVVLFSIVVQGLTIEPLIRRTKP